MASLLNLNSVKNYAGKSNLHRNRDCGFTKDTNAIGDIVSTFKPYLIALTPEERKRIPKMSDATLPFVQKALDYASTNPSFVPAYIDVSELKVDMVAANTLMEVQRPLAQIAQSLDDTMMLCGSEAYIAALAFYNSVKQAAKLKVPGAESIYEDLSTRFAKPTHKTARPATKS